MGEDESSFGDIGDDGAKEWLGSLVLTATAQTIECQLLHRLPGSSWEARPLDPLLGSCFGMIHGSPGLQLMSPIPRRLTYRSTSHAA